MTGTILNVSTVLVGGTVGAVIGERLPNRFRETVMHAIGLMTLLIGFQMALGTRSAIIVLGSVVLGAILGEAAGIDDALKALGDWVERKVAGKENGANHARFDGGQVAGESPFSRGFVMASLVFCVGPMTILGSFQDGLTGVYNTLAVKSVLDGFTAIALASSLGWGVVLSSVVVLVYQGALTMGAVWAKPLLSESVVTEMTAAGGLLIVGIGLNILGLTKIRVANMLPALVMAPLLVMLTAGK